jgi:predicted ATP-grasp superfamily ATP-dependent carboligase
MARILVTDSHLGSAVAVIRSLARRGHHVIAASPEPRSPGSYSRHAAEMHCYPSPSEDAAAAGAALLEVVRERAVDLLIPVTDEVILPIREARDRFAEQCIVALAPDPAFTLARDKVATVELAASLGIRTPRTAVVADAAAARDLAGTLPWPVVVKPRESRVARPDGSIATLRVAYADGMEELERRIAAFEALCPSIVQEYCAGTPIGVELLMHEGRPLAAFQHRRLREVPITGGASSLRESVPLDAGLLRQSVRLLEALDWTGVAMVEFKVGQDGPRLMEINGRIWGSLPLAVRAGMDFPARLADMYLSGPPSAGAPPATSYEFGVRSRNLELDVLWVASVLRRKRRYPYLPAPRRREALVAGLGWLSPADGYDILALRDPWPGLAELARIAKKLPRKVSSAA